MATWQMRASFTRYKVITAGPTFSLRARLSRHYFPLRSEGGPASFLTHFKDRRLYTERVCKEPGIRAVHGTLLATRKASEADGWCEGNYFADLRASPACATTLRRGQKTTECSYVKLPCPSVYTSYSKVRSDDVIVPAVANNIPTARFSSASSVGSARPGHEVIRPSLTGPLRIKRDASIEPSRRATPIRTLRRQQTSATSPPPQSADASGTPHGGLSPPYPRCQGFRQVPQRQS
jgi:hypothetical protein